MANGALRSVRPTTSAAPAGLLGTVGGDAVTVDAVRCRGLTVPREARKVSDPPTTGAEEGPGAPCFSAEITASRPALAAELIRASN
jgi:hypothetical protein